MSNKLTKQKEIQELIQDHLFSNGRIKNQFLIKKEEELKYDKKDIHFTKEQIRNMVSHQRLYQIKKNLDWINKNEHMFLPFFSSGEEVIASNVEPIIEECTSKFNIDLFRYCRFISSIPYSDYVGRRIKFLIRDNSIKRKPIIGIAALGSSIIKIDCRDNWIGWKEKEYLQFKELRLPFIMDLYVAVSIPPYNYLTSGKLICSLMASNEVRNIFINKYKNKPTYKHKIITNDLALIVATSFFGKNSSQYNRLNFNDRKLFLPVGLTKGYSTIHLKPELINALKEIGLGKKLYNEYAFDGGTNSIFRKLRTGLRNVRINPDLILNNGLSRGVYVLPLAHNTREFLRGETNKLNYFNYSMLNLTDYWHNRWLKMRKRNKDVIKKIENFEIDYLKVSRILT